MLKLLVGRQVKRVVWFGSLRESGVRREMMIPR